MFNVHVMPFLIEIARFIISDYVRVLMRTFAHIKGNYISTFYFICKLPYIYTSLGEFSIGVVAMTGGTFGLFNFLLANAPACCLLADHLRERPN